VSLSEKEQAVCKEVIEWEETGRTGDGYRQARVLLSILLRHSQALVQASEALVQASEMITGLTDTIRKCRNAVIN
jgi:hypothetical protein